MDKRSQLDRVPIERWQGVKVAEIDGQRRVVELNLAVALLKGELPTEIRFLTELKKLNLSYNNDLKGELIKEVFSLKNLEVLRANFCGFTGLLHAEIGNLAKLDTLEMWARLPLKNGDPYPFLLSGGVPKEIGQLKNLRYLRLARHNFTGALPEEIGNMENLRMLDFSECNFSGEIPQSLGKLKKLHTLFLDTNKLTGSIP